MDLVTDPSPAVGGRAPLPLLVVALAAAVPAAGCEPTVCDLPVLTLEAALWRVEVFEGDAWCNGTVAASKRAPVSIRDFVPPDEVRLQLPAGAVTVQVDAYRDRAARDLIAQGCTTSQVSSGQTTCLALPLHPVDGGLRIGSDLVGLDPPPASMPDLLPAPDLCTGVVHDNGVGATYLDCAATSDPPTEQRALAACRAYLGAQGSCVPRNKCGSGAAICTEHGDCVCWAFSGPSAGHVLATGKGGCDCPAISDPTWN
jgi:hypothetical protein